MESLPLSEDGLRLPRLAQRSDWIGLIRFVSVTGLAVFVVAVVALHGLRGDLNPAEHTISHYSLGDYGWLMRAMARCTALASSSSA